MNIQEFDFFRKIPSIGFGPGGAGYSPKTKKNSSSLVYRAYNKFVKLPYINTEYVKSITNAINNGFRLIDYSAAYGNGILLQNAIEKSKLSRKDLILTTRVSNKAQFENKVEDEFFNQLKNLKTDYIDILMFHWPVTDLYDKTWKKMISLKEQGYVKVLGVANCKQHHIEKLIDEYGIIPTINQIEIHPLFSQKDLISYCKNLGMVVEAYTPIARFDDRLMRLPNMIEIGKKYGKTIPQIILRWHIQNGVIPIVRTLSNIHQKENLNIMDFELSSEEMNYIDSININSRLRYDADNCDFRIL